MKNNEIYELLVFIDNKKHEHSYLLTTYANAKEILNYPDPSIDSRYWIACTDHIQGIFEYLELEEGNNVFELSIDIKETVK